MKLGRIRRITVGRLLASLAVAAAGVAGVAGVAPIVPATPVGALVSPATGAVVGAPGVDVGGAVDAGAAYVFPISDDGNPSWTSATKLTEANFGVTPAAHDRFGSAVADADV